MHRKHRCRPSCTYHPIITLVGPFSAHQHKTQLLRTRLPYRANTNQRIKRKFEKRSKAPFRPLHAFKYIIQRVSASYRVLVGTSIDYQTSALDCSCRNPWATSQEFECADVSGLFHTTVPELDKNTYCLQSRINER